MQAISRRTVIRALASIPAASILEPISMGRDSRAWKTDASDPKTLLLVFHGLFAFVVWENVKYIQAIAPMVDDHKYLAGGKAYKDLMGLGKGQTYSLTGANDGSLSPGFVETKNSVFVNLHNIDARQSYCQFNLPFPDRVYGLRAVPKQNNCEFYKAAPHLKKKPTELPLIHAFSYTLSGKPAIDGLNGVVFDETTDSYNLHLRAEPESDINAMTGFDSLNKLFPELKAQLATCYDNVYAHPDKKFPAGLSADDECSLAEVKSGGCPAPPATTASLMKMKPTLVDGKLVNCHSVVVIQ